MKIDLRLKLGKLTNAFNEFCQKINHELIEAEEDKFVPAVLKLRREITASFSKTLTDKELDFIIAKSVILDLVTQGWKIKNDGDDYFVEMGENEGESKDQAKKRIRDSHLILRNQQLLEPSVKDFINKCERRRLFQGEWHSIFSLMRDGGNLANELRKISGIQNVEEKTKILSEQINPYIQFAEADKICEFTGIPILEIWRYFRHTWVTPYKVLPGRSIAILIRDAAAQNHPIIGIGALGSSIAQFAARDKWIGWDSKTFIEELQKTPTAVKAKYLLITLDQLLDSIYKKDLFIKGILNRANLQNPTPELIKELRSMGEKEIIFHRKTADHSIFNKLKKNKSNADNDWEAYSNTSLYKSKRYKSLSTLLSIRSTFIKHDFINGTKKELRRCLEFSDFKDAVGQLIRKIKAESVGIKMMDIIICGAIPPYNSLLGGKLVCYLLTSPEITAYYREKYSVSVSIIASSMHGKKIFRKQDLVLLGTTSLYGVGSSQYNRIKIPATEIGGNKNDFIEYVNLGFSEGFGSFHFSQDTIDLIHTRLGRKEKGRVVNSIFGEGANPLLRKMREGLDFIGFSSEQLLKHGNKRVVYCVPLAKNFREVLIGYEKKPKYYFPQNKVKLRTKQLADYWKKRWLLNRIKDEKFLVEAEKHTLDYPIKHGARVPQIEEDELTLFNQ